MTRTVRWHLANSIPPMQVDGPGVYIMRNGDRALVTAWKYIKKHQDDGHWVGVAGESTGRAFNSWMLDGRDCDGYSLWDITAEEDTQ